MTRRRNTLRDVVAGVLIILALLFPWNLYFGLGVPDSSGLIWLVLAVVTLLSLTSIVVSRRINPVTAGRLRLVLNVPYLLLVLAFVVYDAVETVRFGGTVHVAGGIGPGAWLGVAGSLLAAQPLLLAPTVDDTQHRGWLRAARIIGYASMFGASLSSGFNLCWRIRYALRGADGSTSFGTQNIAVIITAVVYGVVALAAVLVASRWILQATRPARFAMLALGASSLLAGILVWLLPIGRELDAFHGIAQNTSTAGVGYEGYLAWAAAAALFVPVTLFSLEGLRADREVWREAIRKGLLLIGVWAVGSVLMRLTDLVVAVLLNYPLSRYDTMTMAAFDLTTAVLAFWLRINLGNRALRPRLVAALSGFLFALTVCRLIVEDVLAPRFETAPGATPNPVYGNNLAQQITSVFDVTLCFLALAIVAGVIVAARIRPLRRRLRRRRPAPRPAGTGPGQRRPGGPPPPSEARTTQFGAAGDGDDAPTTVLSGGAGRSPRIFRSTESAQQAPPKIFRPPGGSS
ncbi:hypothetical protein [Mycobacterium sp. 1423905.2]|uniref:DUF7937 domain-containing protein n=1 Tax=Mycobacterium sp. 1423905.2 TaxID=1856859 RepID=UPI0020A4CBB0|nr:hypothetical protein [Mycobacterium sp. 1423905.2]